MPANTFDPLAGADPGGPARAAGRSASACVSGPHLGGPLVIDAVALSPAEPGTPPALLGMSHCPGRRGVDGAGRHWQRDLAQDLAVIEAWGAGTVLSLIEPHEFTRLGVPDFEAAIAATRLRWLRVPITDMATPGAATLAAWKREGPALAQALARGERVLVHCAAGLGRTGMLVARLLAEHGLPAEEAIARVRAARPGTIETEAQADYVRQGRLGG